MKTKSSTNHYGYLLNLSAGNELQDLKGITDLNSVPNGVYIGTMTTEGVANAPYNGWCYAILFEGNMMKRQFLIMHGREEIYTRFGTPNVWGDWKLVSLNSLGGGVLKTVLRFFGGPVYDIQVIAASQVPVRLQSGSNLLSNWCMSQSKFSARDHRYGRPKDYWPFLRSWGCSKSSHRRNLVFHRCIYAEYLRWITDCNKYNKCFRSVLAKTRHHARELRLAGILMPTGGAV